MTFLTLLLVVAPVIPVRAGPGGTVNISGSLWFDDCQAPNSDLMQNWWNSSPYRNVGVYIGGNTVNGCDFNLSAAWVDKVQAQGWSFVPTYAGRQAPCLNLGSTKSISTDIPTAQQQARNAAADAETKASGFGFTRGTIIYLDIEGYDTANTSCRNVVKAYVAEWCIR